MRLAVAASHPVQYHSPLYRELARRFDLTVFYAHLDTPADQAQAGFGVGFAWDVDLLSGYLHVFLKNAARPAGLDRFGGCDTPEIGARLREGSFDALLVQGWHFKSLLQAAWAAKRQGIPVLVRGDSHLETPRSPVKKALKEILYPPFLRLYDAALYVGQRSREYWEHYRYPKERLFFSPHCVDTEWFASRATREAGAALRARLGILPEARVVLFAGKLIPFKRPLDLVAALAIVREAVPDVTLIVAGDGELRQAMAFATPDASVRCHFLGFRNQTEMPAVYAASNLLVLPSDGRETWGLVANEALACGVPIVVSDAVGCAPDLAGDGIAGRVFPVGEIETLAAAIKYLFRSPPSKRAIASRSQENGIPAAVAGIEAALNKTRFRTTKPR